MRAVCIFLYVVVVAESDNYAGMWDNVVKAARSRAEVIRQSGADPGIKDSLALFVDYASDRLRNPPYDAIERNLLILQLENAHLRHVVNELQRALRDVGILKSNKILKCASKMYPVQSRHTTHITNASQANCGKQ